jgi:alkylhydroperoxidase/carboxymuconolactone decarboxylase family protein YurZ
VQRAAPVLGQHTREVLLEMGITSDEIQHLIAVGAVRAADLSGGNSPPLQQS